MHELFSGCTRCVGKTMNELEGEAGRQPGSQAGRRGDVALGLVCMADWSTAEPIDTLITLVWLHDVELSKFRPPTVRSSFKCAVHFITPLCLNRPHFV